MYIINTMMMWEGIDQRRFPRVNYKCLIRMSKGDQEEVIDTFTENIGAGGICVTLDQDLGLFETVSLELFLGESDEPIACDGTIVWVVKSHPVNKWEAPKFDTGVEFININEDDRQKVFALVESLLNK
jgi:hypothetical protein